MNVSRTKYLIAFFVVLFVTNARAQDTLVFDAAKDTYINIVIGDTYQGQTQSFIASAWTYGGSFGTGRSLLGFETCEIPDNFVVVQATLYLYKDYSASHAGHTTNGLNAAKLFEITSPWDESTVWWTQPTYNTNLFTTVPASTSSSQDYVFDVTPIVANSLSSSNEVGFYFKLDDEVTYRSLVFASRDHPDPNIRPKLELIYTTDTAWCGNSGPSDPPPPPPPVDPIDSLDTNITITPCIPVIKIPNIFTPNGDQVNDNFHIQSDCGLDAFSIDIFNRWGERVFTSSDLNFSWNGKTIGGEELSEGSYFYKVKTEKAGKEETKHGHITLYR
jgi:gliding motility-associated-like protein